MKTVMEMNRDTFKMIHSELIMQVQMIEEDLKVIYAGMKKGNFENNYQELSRGNLGKTIKELRALDNSDGNPELSNADYDLLNEIREIRNYWCHQCFLDYIYIQNDIERERAFQRVAQRLHYDENRTWDLHEKTARWRNKVLQKFRR